MASTYRRGAANPDLAPSILTMVERERHQRLTPDAATIDSRLNAVIDLQVHAFAFKASINLSRAEASRWVFTRWRWRSGRLGEDR